MPVYRSEIAEPQSLEKCARRQRSLYAVFNFMDCIFSCISQIVIEQGDRVPDEFADPVVGFVQRDVDQIVSKSAGAGSDCHLVVVQDNQNIALTVSEVVHCFKCHASGHAAVSYDGDNFFVTSRKVPCSGHPGSGGYGCRCVAGAECIVRTFGHFRKTCQTVEFPVCVHLVFSAGQYFMYIGLMAHVPDNLVIRSLVYIVQGYRHLNDTET